MPCFFVLLSSRGNSDSTDLNQYILGVKVEYKGAPETSLVETFMFNPDGLRDPFKLLEQPQQSEDADISTGSGIKPDTNRRKEDLEAFPLDGLKMVGTIAMKSSLWGLVKPSDSTIYRVYASNYTGCKLWKNIAYRSRKKLTDRNSA